MRSYDLYGSPSPSLDELSGFDSFEFDDDNGDDFETVPTNYDTKTNYKTLLCCDACDPLHNYYSAHPRRRRVRAYLPRFFYCISIFQIATLITATLTVTGDYCGPLPGNLVGTQTTTSPPSSFRKSSSSSLVPTTIPSAKSISELIPPSNVFLQQTSTVYAKPSKPSTSKSTSKSSLKSSSKTTSLNPSKKTATIIKTNTKLPLNPQTATSPHENSHSNNKNGTLIRMKRVWQQEWSTAQTKWSAFKSDIKIRVVGKIKPINIDCDRCEKHSTSPKSMVHFRPFSIVLGAVLPIFLASSIIIVVGVSAVSNYVLIGPQRLVCYTLLCIFTAIFSFHFSVVQNVTASRLSNALAAIPMQRTLCRSIVQHQMLDHKRSDILWALHAVTNVFSAMLSIIGLCGWHDLHDEAIDEEMVKEYRKR